MVEESKNYFKCRDGALYTERSKDYIAGNINVYDYEAVCAWLKNLDYPFIYDIWMNLVRSFGDNAKIVLNKYVATMNLPSYKPLSWKDTQDLNKKYEDQNSYFSKAKEYGFDSLVYRFKDYQSRAFMAEVEDYKYKHSCSTSEARSKIANRHNRDLMKFISILNDMIGEHN